MQIIQPHYHAIARTAQDYEKMAMSGVVAVAEPAFWAGFDRLYPETFIDYFRQISEFEPTRAAQYGIRHFCWIAVNPKEAENVSLTREVLGQMPEFSVQEAVEVFHNNPCHFLGQNPKFDIQPIRIESDRTESGSDQLRQSVSV